MLLLNIENAPKSGTDFGAFSFTSTQGLYFKKRGVLF